jgi:carbonic anhydrase/acetyltransferase-like protein (isoleucine patch superfamily)
MNGSRVKPKDLSYVPNVTVRIGKKKLLKRKRPPNAPYLTRSRRYRYGRAIERKNEHGGRMKDKKYETRPENGMLRIIALKDFLLIKKGDLGGLIEEEKNLSQNGDAWVSGNAQVSGNARVYGDAWVYGNALVSGNAQVYDNARVYGNAQVYGNAWVSGNAQVSGNARVYGDAWVYGDTLVSGNAQVSGNTRVSGKADMLLIGPMGPRKAFTTFFIEPKQKRIAVACGCWYGGIDEFTERVKETHGKNEHSHSYMAAITAAKAILKIRETEAT